MRRKTASSRRKEPTGKTKVVVASPPCVPARYWALTALKPYQATHVLKTYSQSANKTGKDGLSMIGDELVAFNVAEVTVPRHRARWVEYLLLCSGHFRLISPPIDPMNAAWAEGNGYQLPTPWNPQEQQMIAQSDCAKRRAKEIEEERVEKRRRNRNAPERAIDRLVRFVKG